MIALFRDNETHLEVELTDAKKINIYIYEGGDDVQGRSFDLTPDQCVEMMDFMNKQLVSIQQGETTHR